MSHEEIEKVTFTIPTAVVSISSDEIKPRIIDARDVLFLKFDDIDVGYAKKFGLEEDDLLRKFNLFSKEQAQQILDFVEKHRDCQIVCQCEAGISRSAGVAAALSIIYNNDKAKWVFENRRYFPNMYVFKTILNLHFYNDMKGE